MSFNRTMSLMMGCGIVLCVNLFIIADHVDGNRDDKEREFCASMNAERVDPPGLGSDFVCTKDGEVVYSRDD
jgi:hypothetical protein